MNCKSDSSHRDTAFSKLIVSEANYCRIIAELLPSSVFWDKQNLKDAQNWEDGFKLGLKTSCLYLPLISFGAVKTVI